MKYIGLPGKDKSKSINSVPRKSKSNSGDKNRHKKLKKSSKAATKPERKEKIKEVRLYLHSYFFVIYNFILINNDVITKGNRVFL